MTYEIPILKDDEIQILRDQLDLDPEEILISPVTKNYVKYHHYLVLSRFYEKQYKTDFDIYMFIVPNDTFIFFCRIGDLVWAKELLHLGDVSLEHCHKSSFKWACNNEHLEIAQWLYSLRYIGPDILERQIEKCVYNKAWIIVKWLWFFVSKNQQNNILYRLRQNDHRDIAKRLKLFNKPLVFKTSNKMFSTEENSEENSEKQFIPPEPKVYISKRKKYTPTDKMIKFWGLDEKTKLSFIDIRKKFITYIITNKLNENKTIKTDEKINSILGITKNTIINISYLDNVVMHFY